MKNQSEFFELHKDLPREGSGDQATLTFVLDLAGVPSDGHLLDAACGPGADIDQLLAAVPEGHVTAVDGHAPFVNQITPRDRLTAKSGDMFAEAGPFDFIWCAGAVYFTGVTEALNRFRPMLASDGAVAFTEACWFTNTPSEAARANWQEYEAMTDENGVLDQVRAAGYEVLGTLRVSDQGWENYYKPVEVRIARLRPVATPAMKEVLDEAEAEIAAWRNHRDEFGYLCVLARPV